jgi:hypothetical protein
VRTALLVLLALVAAGCSGPATPESAPSPTASATPPPTTNPPSNATEPPAEVETEVPYERSGTTWTTVCVGIPPAVGQCRHLQEGSDLTEFLPEGGTVSRFQGTLAWSGGNERMGIGIVYEEGETLAASTDDYAEGPSPLAFDFDVADLAGKRLGYHVASYVSAGVPQAHVDASPGQDWQLQGTLTVLKAAGP